MQGTLDNTELNRQVAESVMPRKSDGQHDYRPYATHYPDALDALTAAGAEQWAKSQDLAADATGGSYQAVYPADRGREIRVHDTTRERAWCRLALEIVDERRKRAGMGP